MGKHRAASLLAVALVLLVGTIPALAIELPEVTPSVGIRLESSRIQLEADKPATLAVRVTVPDGHHAYLDKGEEGSFQPIQIDLSDLQKGGIQVRPLHTPEGEADRTVRATVLRGEGTFTYELTVQPQAKVAASEFDVKIRSQICNESTGSCYFPETHTRRLAVDIKSVPPGSGVGAGPVGAPKAEAGLSQPPAESGGDASSGSSVSFMDYKPRTDVPAHGLLVWMLLALVAGMVLNVMPCVLPVVSIKVLSFVQQAGESRRRILALGVAFAAGMITVFLALALVAILFGLGWGEQFQSQTFLVVMIGIVFALSLSLFGIYELGVPGKVGELAAAAPREGLGAAFTKGMLATVLATPCSGPFLGSTLAWTLSQPPTTVLLIFLMLGFGMALPYVVLTANPALLKIVPRPGPWMETFKRVMGFLLLATVVYLMISLDQDLHLFTVAFLVFVAMACGIWGRFSLRSSTRSGRAAVLAIALVVLGLGAHLSFRSFRGLFEESASGSGAHIAWEPFDSQRLAQYHREGRNVFLEFKADWCPNCKFNEVTVYNSEEIRGLLKDKGVVAMEADLTREGPDTDMLRRFMRHLGSRSVPFMAIFPGDSPLEPYTRHDLVGKKDMRGILKALPDASLAPTPASRRGG